MGAYIHEGMENKKEPSNIRINLYVTQSIWNRLKKMKNYSEYIRGLVENDLLFKELDHK